jgi:hypothetical protein
MVEDNIEFEIIDNFLEQENFKKIIDTLTNNNFPWYYNDSCILTSVNNKNYKEGPQLTHIFVKDGKIQSNETLSIINLFNNEFLKKFSIFRMKANLKFTLLSKAKYPYNEPHYDSKIKKCFIGIYYLNTSDGDTYLFNENKEVKAKISPRKNRFVFFKNDILHSSNHPKNYNKRLIINFNLILNE